MTIPVNGNFSPVSWESLLQQVGEFSKASEIGDKPVLTFTTTEADGTQRTVSINIPDDLDLPSTVDQGAIDSLCAKLAADPDLGVTLEQIDQLREALTAALLDAGVDEICAFEMNAIVDDPELYSVFLKCSGNFV